ncbi:unnamed protein product [Hymenolepis diminuta]|uniref:mannose-6-phosphate isomerase n=1 Tax=Hymenolepis diminuta TaxID=6216 RepID=A0A0R3SIE8_HYMDI|nr:unnamed protein product [Hymenolepis diminuta]VUZ43711.1 unnamed protein product [Hymenolepis diminuta]
MQRLKCISQVYDWGKVGNASKVYQLQVSSKNPDEFNSERSYAELWMGIHPSGPSVLWNNHSVSLDAYIREHPEYLGTPCVNNFGQQLPFLFKVLSVAKALSIQAHPDKKLAEKLHADRPDIYKDDNHKPEMAIALTPFEALIGFRPLVQIRAFITHLSELAELTSNPSEVSKEETIRSLYSHLMHSSSEKVEAAINSLVEKFTQSSGSNLKDIEDVDSSSVVELFLRLNQQFPGDVGCLSVFFFNYIKMKPGEAIFLKANTPHAYLSGDCVECMANSDNVVRAGLTPKFKDVERLLDMLEYEAPKEPSNLRFSPISPPKTSTPVGVKLESFVPPVSEFAVDTIQFDKESREFSLPPVPTASILLLIHGEGVIKTITPGQAISEEFKFGPGHVYFVPADMKVNLTSKRSDTHWSLNAFRAYVNLS